jgi:hypothetical protein
MITLERGRETDRETDQVMCRKRVEAVKTDAGKLPGCSRSTGNRRVIG